MAEKYAGVGHVVQIIGPVMDIQFEAGHLPAIYNACRITSEGYNLPEPLDVTAEVQQHLGEGRVRAVAMEPVEGMVRGMKASDLGLEMSEGGVIVPGNTEKSRAALIYGQMTEPPGSRLRVGLTGLTVAEYFRDQEHLDVLLFIDNIFRFVQAGSEVSALLGRMPSAVGYQPNLNTEIGELQERITSTKTGSITSVQAIYVPAADYTDPAPAAT